MGAFRLKQWLPGLALCLLAPVLAACGVTAAQPSAVSSQSSVELSPSSDQVAAVTPTPAVLIVGEALDLPQGCSPEELVDVVLSFFDAYNAGDQTRLTQFFDPWIKQRVLEGRYADNFLNESDAVVGHFDTANRDELLPYFAERHRQHDQFHLLAIDAIAPQSGGRDPTMMVRYLRQADDLPATSDAGVRVVHSPATIRCHDHKISTWVANSGQYQQDVDTWLRRLCDLPNEPRPTVLVCAEWQPPRIPK